MESLHEKVIAVLRSFFADLDDGLETVPETGRVLGSIISPAFRGLDHELRQDRVWKVLGKELSAEELKHIGPIVTLTPAEAAIDVSVDR